MYKQRCEFCGKEFNSLKVQRFCNFLCQRKHYNRRPEIREKYKLRMRLYRLTHPEWKEKHRIQQAKYKERIKLYNKKYHSRPDVKARLNKNERWKLKNNIKYNIASRLRKALRHALLKYSSDGKIKCSRKYGLDWAKVIEHLKPFPEDITQYEIDHILPLYYFDLNKPEEIRRAFAPENLQWLTIAENRSKGRKLPVEVKKQPLPTT